MKFVLGAYCGQMAVLPTAHKFYAEARIYTQNLNPKPAEGPKPQTKKKGGWLVPTPRTKSNDTKLKPNPQIL